MDTHGVPSVKRAFAPFLLSLGMAASPTQAGDLASIRVSAFEITDPRRVEEIEKIREWYRGETDADKDKVSRDFWYLLLKAAAENRAQESPNSPPISDDDLKKALEEMGFENDTEMADHLVRALEHVSRMDREKGVLLYGVTRGMQPQILQECVVAAGKEVAARGWEHGRQFTIYYRVERIESDRLHMEISEDWGDPLGRFSTGAEGFAYAYPFRIPMLRSQSSSHGATSSYSLEFIEVRLLASAAKINICRVSYPAGEGPPPTDGDRGAQDERQRELGAPRSAGGIISVSPPAESR
jgi:hypothetical protein